MKTTTSLIINDFAFLPVIICGVIACAIISIIVYGVITWKKICKMDFSFEIDISEKEVISQLSGLEYDEDGQLCL